MVYFVADITYNEIIRLQKNLPDHTYCLFQTSTGKSVYYGVVKEMVYHTLLHTLSAETLEQLEYLSEEEFGRLISGQDRINCIGSNTVIARFIKV